MQIDLTGRRALVTGSTAGIGFAAAAGLARAGAAVVVNGRGEERVAAAVEALRERVDGADVSGVAADVGSPFGIAKLVDAAPDVDVLVNNAGVFAPTAFADIPDDEWQRLFDVNVMSGVRLSRHHVPRMAARGWGRVVFVSSESAVQIPAEMVHYGMTKTAQLALSRGIAESYPGSGVTVNAVLPGPTRSEGIEAFLAQMAARRGGSTEDAEATFIANERPTSLLQRLIDVDEVAAMIVYLSSPQASATTGAALRVDGGVTRGIP